MHTSSTRHILVIVPFPMPEEQLAHRQKQLKSVRIGSDMQFDFNAVSFAPSNYVSGHDALLAEAGIVAAGINAQKQGYDAVCIDTMSDSGMNVLRSMLDIPVIGPGRHALLCAQMLAERFSILAMWQDWFPLYKKTLAELGMHEKCASMRSIDMQPNNKDLLGEDNTIIFSALLNQAKRCIDEDGAQAIILGSTTMHEAHTFLAENLAVPVINPGPLSYRMVDTALKLGLGHSKKAYPTPLGARANVFEAFHQLHHVDQE